VQHYTFQYRELIYDKAEIIEAQIAVVLAREQRSRALLA
jgi:hypothetical protein